MATPCKYPWHKTQQGEAFFVPALDLEATQREGLKAALLFRFRGRPRTAFGIYKGRLGVMFWREAPYEPPKPK
jgi:hypothetical protein